MTRVNAHIKPSKLIDQHLIAEYREIVRIPNAVMSNPENARKAISKAPKVFKLGTGHVVFFYDKLSYLHKRYNDLKSEMDRRGIINEMGDDMFVGIPSEFYKDFPEDQKLIAKSLLKERIIERVRSMGKTPRYYKQEVSLGFVQELLK